jgi:CheY-like chemotaxis protein
VLIVDDNTTSRDALSAQLTHAGYQATTACTALEALELLRTPGAAFDFVVLDHHLPDADGARLGEEIARSEDIAPTRLVMLTSVERFGDAQRYAALGFASCLTKPVRAQELLDALARATVSHDRDAAQLPAAAAGSAGAVSEDAHAPGARVLLVEDNIVNQRVARRFLERLRCEVEVVDDGAQAVAAYGRRRYSLILMDMQMPVMDGLEATRRIRASEAGGARTPIVALTADAMAGTLERCLAAGMDDYLTKPLDAARLSAVIKRFTSPEPDRMAS